MGRSTVTPFAAEGVRAYIRDHTAADARTFTPSPSPMSIDMGRPNASGIVGRVHLFPFVGPEYQDVLRYLEPAAVRRLDFQYVHAPEVLGRVAARRSPATSERFPDSSNCWFAMEQTPSTASSRRFCVSIARQPWALLKPCNGLFLSQPRFISHPASRPGMAPGWLWPCHMPECSARWISTLSTCCRTFQRAHWIRTLRTL